MTVATVASRALAGIDAPRGTRAVDLRPGRRGLSAVCARPIGLGSLAASGRLSVDALAGQEFAGELSLTGELRPLPGRGKARLAPLWCVGIGIALGR